MRLTKASRYIKSRLVRSDLPSALDSEITVATVAECGDHAKDRRKQEAALTQPPKTVSGTSTGSVSLNASPPTDYQIVTEPCDWCLVENPWEQFHQEDEDNGSILEASA